MTSHSDSRPWLLSLAAAVILTVAALSTPQTSAASAPTATSLTAEAVATGIRVSWTTPDTSGSDVVGTLDSFDIMRSDGRAGEWNQVGTAVADEVEFVDSSGYIDGRFPAYSRHRYRVVAVYVTDADEEVRSETQEDDWVEIRAPVYRDASNLKAVLTSAGVSLTWTAPEAYDEEDRPTLTGYVISSSSSASNVQTFSLESDVLEYTLEWQPDGGYKVFAIWGVFESASVPFPETTESTDDSPWRPPTDVGGSAEQRGLRVTWTSPYPSGATVPGRLTGYEVQRKNADGDFETVGEDIARNTRNWLDTDAGDGFVSGQSRVYRVIATYQNEDEEDRESAPSAEGTIVVPTFAAPTGLEYSTQTASGDGELTYTISWTAPTLSWESSLPALSGYQLVITVDDVATTEQPSAEDTSHDHDEASDASVSYELTALYGIYSAPPVMLSTD